MTYLHKWIYEGRPGYPWPICADCGTPRTVGNDLEPCPEARELKIREAAEIEIDIRARCAEYPGACFCGWHS